MTSMKARFRASLNPLVVAFLVSCGGENLGPVGSDSGGADGSGGAGGTGTSGGDLVVGTYGDGGLTETSGPPADAGPCDPLAPHELPVILGKVLGVGKGSTGTLYLADEAPATYQYRVFVSQGNVLWRKRVMGSGSNGDGADVDYTLGYEDGASNSALLVQIRGGVTTGMALGPGDSRAFLDVNDPDQVQLVVVDASVLNTMTLRNLPGDVYIEYVADVSNGDVIVVTRPLDDWTYAQFRVFYGTPDAMLERTVVSVARGDDTYVTFQVGSVDYLAHFVGGFESSDGGAGEVDEPGTLDPGDGSVLTITERLPTPTTLTGFSFTCL